MSRVSGMCWPGSSAARRRRSGPARPCVQIDIAEVRRGLHATHRHELVGGDVVGQRQPPVAHQHRRPDDRMEGNVIFADEIVRARGRVAVGPEHPRTAARRPARPLPLPTRCWPSSSRSRRRTRRRCACCSKPATGTGTPQSMSRVIARGRSPSVIQFSAKCVTLGRHVFALRQQPLQQPRLEAWADRGRSAPSRESRWRGRDCHRSCNAGRATA